MAANYNEADSGANASRQSVVINNPVYNGPVEQNINQTQTLEYRNKVRIDSLKYYFPEELPIQVRGRDDILDTISEEFKERRRIAITGPAGIGKTYVALQFGLNWYNWKPNDRNILFFNCQSRNLITSSLKSKTTEIELMTTY